MSYLAAHQIASKLPTKNANENVDEQFEKRLECYSDTPLVSHDLAVCNLMIKSGGAEANVSPIVFKYFFRFLAAVHSKPPNIEKTTKFYDRNSANLSADVSDKIERYLDWHAIINGVAQSSNW